MSMSAILFFTLLVTSAISQIYSGPVGRKLPKSPGFSEHNMKMREPFNEKNPDKYEDKVLKDIHERSAVTNFETVSKPLEAVFGDEGYYNPDITISKLSDKYRDDRIILGPNPYEGVFSFIDPRPKTLSKFPDPGEKKSGGASETEAAKSTPLFRRFDMMKKRRTEYQARKKEDPNTLRVNDGANPSRAEVEKISPFEANRKSKGKEDPDDSKLTDSDPEDFLIISTNPAGGDLSFVDPMNEPEKLIIPSNSMKSVPLSKSISGEISTPDLIWSKKRLTDPFEKWTVPEQYKNDPKLYEEWFMKRMPEHGYYRESEPTKFDERLKKVDHARIKIMRRDPVKYGFVAPEQVYYRDGLIPKIIEVPSEVKESVEKYQEWLVNKVPKSRSYEEYYCIGLKINCPRILKSEGKKKTETEPLSGSFDKMKKEREGNEARKDDSKSIYRMIIEEAFAGLPVIIPW